MDTRVFGMLSSEDIDIMLIPTAEMNPPYSGRFKLSEINCPLLMTITLADSRGGSGNEIACGCLPYATGEFAVYEIDTGIPSTQSYRIQIDVASDGIVTVSVDGSKVDRAHVTVFGF